MKKLMKMTMVFFLVATLALVPACAHMSNRSRTQAEGLFVGAGIVGLISYGVGYALCGKDCAQKGLLIGLAIGAIGGALYGNHVANKKAEYANDEEWLKDCLAQARASNEDAEEYNAKLKEALNVYKREIKSINPKTIAAELEQSEKILAGLNNEIAQQNGVIKSTAANDQIRSLQKEVEALEKQKEELEASNKELAAILSRRVAI